MKFNYPDVFRMNSIRSYYRLSYNKSVANTGKSHRTTVFFSLQSKISRYWAWSIRFRK